MKVLSRNAVVMAAGALLLGSGLAFSTAGAVRGANQGKATNHQIQPDKKAKSFSCNIAYEACVVGNNSATNGYGVEGEAPYTGVWGHSTSGYGIGVSGNSTSGYGGVFSGATGVYAESPDTPLYSSGTASPHGVFYTDTAGDGVFSGKVTADGGFATVVKTRGGGHVNPYGAMSTEAILEDTGTARIIGGAGAVRFDRAFAQSIETSRGYQVFLTPDGDTRGLYVAQKYEGGFIVRETERGHDSLDFDWRVVAHPYGASTQRLPVLDIKRPQLPTQLPR
jgi:hypothetical protein